MYQLHKQDVYHSTSNTDNSQDKHMVFTCKTCKGKDDLLSRKEAGKLHRKHRNVNESPD